MTDSFAEARNKARRSLAEMGWYHVRTALEEYATDHDGRYPATGGWIATLKQAGFSTPASPWSQPGGSRPT